MKTIPLTRGLVTIVDDDVAAWAGKHHWNAQSPNCRGQYYAARWRNGKLILLHREILNPPPGVLVDHRSGDTLDNRRENLRCCNANQNMRNSKVPPKRAKVHSCFKGVYWVKRIWKWAAIIYVEGRMKRLGLFDDEIKAAHAYDYAAIRYHGEFAAPNFVNGHMNPRVFRSKSEHVKAIRVSRIPNKYGLRGVTKEPKGKRYRAIIRIAGKAIYSKRFDTKEEAAKAYDILARKHHGRLAILNFPEQPCQDRRPDVETGQ